MKKLVLLIALSSLVATSALANTLGQKCANRVRTAGCYLSNNDFGRIDSNVATCKQVRSGSGKTTLEIFVLKNSDKVVVVKTAGEGVDMSQPAPRHCPVVKYTIDYSGIKEIKIIDNKTFLLSNDGQLYYMLADQTVYEVLTARRDSYKSIADIKGLQAPKKGIQLIYGSGAQPYDLTDKELNEKISEGKVRKVQFNFTSTQRSLFRDE
jgi:hypothetical protein